MSPVSARQLIIRVLRVYILLLLAGILPKALLAGELRKLRQFELESAETGSVITDLGYSPDGDRIAVAMLPPGRNPILVIIDAESGREIARYVLGRPLYSSLAALSEDQGINWTPDGATLVAGALVLNLATGTSCALPLPGAITGRNSVMARGIRDYVNGPLELMTFDPECRVVTRIQTPPGHVLRFRAAPDAGLVFFSHSRIVSYQKRLLGNYVASIGADGMALPDLTLRSDRPRRPDVPSDLEFADAGKGLCGARKEVVHCYSSDQLRLLGSLKGGYSLSVRTALRAPVVVISSRRKFVDVIDWQWAAGGLNRRTIWNYATGDTAHWRPGAQEAPTESGRVARIQRPFCISPDGRFVAEGAGHRLIIHRFDAKR